MLLEICVAILITTDNITPTIVNMSVVGMNCLNLRLINKLIKTLCFIGNP